MMSCPHFILQKGIIIPRFLFLLQEYNQFITSRLSKSASCQIHTAVTLSTAIHKSKPAFIPCIPCTAKKGKIIIVASLKKLSAFILNK